MNCTAPPTGSGFLASTLANLDCQAKTIGEAGYLALSNSGSPLSLALTGLLSIFVAVIGIRYLTAKPLGVDEWIAAALKIGFVLALAASWPAYRTVVYDVVLKAPAEISGSIGRASALPGSDGGLMARLQGVDNGITALVLAGSGRLDISSRTPAGSIAPPLADDTAFGLGKTLFTSSIIASFAVLRLGGGIFLALAPLFAGLLLFEASRFLFFGWLRSLIAIALGSLGLAIVLGVQLAIIEPWLSQVLAMRAAKITALSAPFELLTLTLSFAVAMLCIFALAVRIAFASAAVTKVQAMLEQAAHSLRNHTQTDRLIPALANDNLTERSRAQEIAQSLRQTMPPNSQSESTVNGVGSGASRAAFVNDPRRQDNNSNVPLGRIYPAPSRRVSGQALKRKPA